MAVLPVQIIPPTFPEGFCPETWQAGINLAFSGAQITSLINSDKVIVSDSAPSDHTKLWFRTSGGAPAGPPSIPLFAWHAVLGLWVAGHPHPEGWQHWQEFSDPADVDTFDGGSAGVVGLASGPFWRIDTRYEGRSPMAPGNIPGANPAKTLGYGEDFGEGAHLQDQEEVGPHTHPLTAGSSIVDGDNIRVVTSGVGNAGLQIGNTGTADQPLRVLTNKYVASQQAMPVIHSVRGQSCIIRTARLWYVG